MSEPIEPQTAEVPIVIRHNARWSGNAIRFCGVAYQPFEMFYDVANEGFDAWRWRMKMAWRAEAQNDPK